MQVVEEINNKSADFAGMKVPVKVSIDRDTKEFEIEIGTPQLLLSLWKNSALKKLLMSQVQIL